MKGHGVTVLELLRLEWAALTFDDFRGGTGEYRLQYVTQYRGLENELLMITSSYAEQVTKMRHLIEELGYAIATPKEARETLRLKGADRVKF